MTVPAWASDFVTSFYAKVADVNAPSNYAAQFVPDGDLYLRGDFKGHEQIEQAQKGFWTRVKASKHHSLKVFYNEQYPDTIFVNGLVDLDQNDGNNLKDVEFVSRFVLDSDKKIKKYRVWTCESLASSQGLSIDAHRWGRRDRALPHRRARWWGAERDADGAEEESRSRSVTSRIPQSAPVRPLHLDRTAVTYTTKRYAMTS